MIFQNNEMFYIHNTTFTVFAALVKIKKITFFSGISFKSVLKKVTWCQLKNIHVVKQEPHNIQTRVLSPYYSETF